MAAEGLAALIALVAATLGTGAALLFWARERLGRRALRRRFARAEKGEAHARDLLQRWGFAILADQPSFEGAMEVDGEVREISIRPDFLVEKRGELAAVEVKTGESAVDPAKRHTRRQLREYAALAPVDALYLLDAEGERLLRVRFPESERGVRGRRGASLRLFVLGVAVGLALAALGAWLVGL